MPTPVSVTARTSSSPSRRAFQPDRAAGRSEFDRVEIRLNRRLLSRRSSASIAADIARAAQGQGKVPVASALRVSVITRLQHRADIDRPGLQRHVAASIVAQSRIVVDQRH